MKTATKPRGFRPWPENQQRLDYAESIGLQINAVVNEVLSKHLKDYIESVRGERVKALKAAITAPVP